MTGSPPKSRACAFILPLCPVTLILEEKGTTRSEGSGKEKKNLEIDPFPRNTFVSETSIIEVAEMLVRGSLAHP